MKWLMKKFALTEEGAKGTLKAIWASFFVNFTYMAAMMIMMYFAKNVLDGNHVPLIKYLVIIAGVGIAMYICLDMDYKNTFNTTYKEAQNLRIEIADQLKKLPLSYFSKHDLSDLAQTIMQDVLDLEHAVSHAIPRAIGYGIFLIIIIISMIFANAKIALALSIPFLIGMAIIFLSKKSQKLWTEKFFWKLRDNSEVFQEGIEMQQEIKSYGLIQNNKKRVFEALEDSERLHIDSELRQAIPLSFSFSVLKIAIGAVILVSSSLLAKNEIEVIFLIGFLIGSVKLVDALSATQENMAEMFFIDARVKRINELRKTPLQKGKDVDLKNFDVEFKNVSFGYKKDYKVVNDISFIAKQGEVTALVGPSGCGKTTVLRLLSRLYDYDLGKIEIDGHDIKDISTDALFSKVSMVFQDVTLFNATIMENIRIGRPGASDDEVMAAAKAANCEEFINKLEGGYNCLIGENGSKLSGGERQRLSIARAFLKNAPILLLDEISASLDVENEMKIQESLNKLIVGKTVIIISHRLKSIEGVDKIVVMDDGKINAQGNHEQLLKTSDLYRRLIEKSNLTEQFTY